mgnify:CR=1 FL=1
MEKGFWHQCWQNNTIGFHQDDVHPLLRQHFEQYIPGNNHTILVPLCGKSLDMVCLSQFGRVIGSELSELACRDFFKEQQLKPEVTAESDSLTRYQVGDLSIYQGDFFTLSGKIINSPINVIYDRAALIALPKTMRQKYVDKLSEYKSELLKSNITPRTGVNSCIKDIETHEIGIFLKKFDVPSNGSTTQKNSSRSPLLPDSSAKIGKELF